MKKITAFLLAVALCFSLCACGKTMCSVEGCKNKAVDDETYGEPYCAQHLKVKKAFDASGAVYENINSAYELIEEYASDIYDAWLAGIYDDDEILEDGIDYLAGELSLTKSELEEGLIYAIASATNSDVSDITASQRNDFIQDSNIIFQVFEDSLFSFCVSVVNGAYEANGETERVQRLLDEAKTQMREMSEKYSDYEHYPALKGYYTTSSSFFDFCQNPTGSFDQMKTTVENYKSTARDYRSDLDYIFGD